MDPLFPMRTTLRSLLLPCLLIPASLLVAGCDGFETGTAPEEITDEQVTSVQFVAPGTSTGEQDTVRISVELTTPEALPGELSAEILFAEDASSANRLDFGEAFPEDAANRALKRSVTFPEGAESGATRTVVFDDLNDDVDSGEEDAFEEEEQLLETGIFTLQQVQLAGDSAQIGEPGRFDLLIGVLDVGDAREQGAAGNFIATRGIVTRAKGVFTRFQDDTGGLVLRQFESEFGEAVQSGDIQAGDEIQVTGNTSFFSGLQQINQSGDENDLSDFDVVSRDNPLPDPQTVTVGEVLSNGEAFESKLIRIEGLTTDASGSFEAETNYTVSDGTGSITLRPPSTGDTDIVGEEIPSGEFVYRGVLGQFNGGFGGADEPDSGYQLQPVRRDDVFVPEQ